MTEAGPSTQSVLTLAPPGALMEFERLRHALGFAKQPPRLIDGRYRVDRTLGRGGMGEVVLAYDHRLERQVALKLVRASLHISAHTLQTRLEREALALARVDHINVIGIHDVGTHDDQPYFTMQFVPGETLREWQANSEHGVAARIEVYLQAARGLAAAHAGGVVHRDFKPDNVIVGEDGIVRVLDFGIAAALRPELALVEPEARNLDAQAFDTAPGTSDTDQTDAASAGSGLAPMTRAGALLGTLPYMSPEQLEGRQADAFSDQFGFGVALWEGLSGTRPFEGRSPGQLRLSIDRGPRGESALPRWLRPILTRALAIDPRERWGSMRELITAIERRRTRGRRVGLAVGLSLGLAAATALGRSSAPSAPPPGPSCASYLAAVDSSWTPQRRAALEQRAATQANAGAGRYALATLDRLAEDWRVRAGMRCEGQLAPAQDAHARACLDGWVERFDSTIELLLERGDAHTFARAPDLLARLELPPDECAGRPERPIDPELWRLAMRAEQLALLGDSAAAARLAEAALARASELGAAPFSAESALAHLSRGEVAALARELPRATRELAEAERHALGSETPSTLLSVWTLAAKLEAIRGASESAAGYAARAEPLSFVLELAPDDPRQAELREAQGLSARARGEQAVAIAHHRAAHDLFEAARQPTLAVKSLVNIGANFQDLDEPERARAAYDEAIALIEANGLPPSYPNRIRLARDLGLLAYASEDPAVIAGALEHFAFIVEHGAAQEVLEAHELRIAVALELGEREQITHMVEAALAALARQPDASPAQRFALDKVAGIALARIGDPRGEPMLEAAASRAQSLSPLHEFNLHSSWVDWLEEEGRCAEASERRRALAERMLSMDEDARPSQYASWADYGPDFACTPT